MRSDDRHVARLRIRIVQRNILLDGEMQHLFLRGAGCARILSDVLAGRGVLDDAEGER